MIQLPNICELGSGFARNGPCDQELKLESGPCQYVILRIDSPGLEAFHWRCRTTTFLTKGVDPSALPATRLLPAT